VSVLSAERAPSHVGRWILVIGGAAAAGVAASLAFLVEDEPEISCDPDPALFAGRFDDARAAEVRRAVAALPNATPAAVDAILVRLGDHRHGIERELRATCEATRDGALGENQARTRFACLERRTYELGAVAARLVAAPRDLLRARDLAQ